MLVKWRSCSAQFHHTFGFCSFDYNPIIVAHKVTNWTLMQIHCIVKLVIMYIFVLLRFLSQERFPVVKYSRWTVALLDNQICPKWGQTFSCWCLSVTEISSCGVRSPTMLSAMSCTNAIFMHLNHITELVTNKHLIFSTHNFKAEWQLSTKLIKALAEIHRIYTVH